MLGTFRQLFHRLTLLPFALISVPSALLKIFIAILKHGPRKPFKPKLRFQPPRCMQDPDLGCHGYVYLEDVRLHYVVTGSERKPLMLLVHGFPEFWYSWRYQLKEFKNDYRVVAIDQRGYGESDSPPSVSSYEVAKLALDIKNFVKALGYDKCVLVGHDWGGNVCWRVAQAHPEVVDKLVIMNCPSPNAQLECPMDLKQLRKFLYLFFFQLPWLPELNFTVDDFSYLDDMFLGDYLGVKSGKMTQEDVDAYKKRCFSSYQLLHPAVSGPSLPKIAFTKVTVPTYIIWGDQDPILGPEFAKLSSELSVEGGAPIYTIEGASHWVQMDQPERVNKVLREVLSKKRNGM